MAATTTFLLLLLFHYVSGDQNIASVISHVTKMEQTITSLQAEVKTTNDKLQTTEDELVRVKAKLQATEDELNLVKRDIQKCPSKGQFAVLKTEVESLKVTSGTSPPINSTVNDTFSVDIKSNMRAIQALNSELLLSSMVINKTSQGLKSIEARLDFLTLQMGDRNSNRTKLAYGESFAFQVSQRGRGSHVYGILKFNTVDYNAGNAYNNVTGLFTAPVPGSYIFWASVEFDIAINNYIVINKGQQELAKAYARPERNYNDPRDVSVMAACYLDKGDEVHFSSLANPGYIHGYGMSSYGGGLLHVL